MIHHIQIGAHLFIEGKRTNNHKKDWHAHWNLDQESNLDQHTKTLYKLGENAKGGDNVAYCTVQTIKLGAYCNNSKAGEECELKDSEPQALKSIFRTHKCHVIPYNCSN